MVLKLLRDVFSGLFTAEHWRYCWAAFLELFKSPRTFFAGIGKPETDRKAFLLGLTSSLSGTLLMALSAAGLFGLLGGFRGIWIVPALFLFLMLLWLVGVILLYTVIAWVNALAVKWVIGPFEIAKVRPILFVLGVSALGLVIPGFGGIVGFVVVVVFTVIAYEAVFRATRGQAIGAAILGYVLTSIPAILLSIAMTGLIAAYQTAGIYGLASHVRSWEDAGRALQQFQGVREERYDAGNAREESAMPSEDLVKTGEPVNTMDEMVTQAAETPIDAPAAGTDQGVNPPDAESVAMQDQASIPVIPTAVAGSQAPSVPGAIPKPRAEQPRPTPTEEVFPEQPRTIQIYRVPAKKK